MNRGACALGVTFMLASVGLAAWNASDAGVEPIGYAAFGALTVSCLLANVVVQVITGRDRVGVFLSWVFIIVGALFVAGPVTADGVLRSYIGLALGCSAIAGVMMGCEIAKGRLKNASSEPAKN